MVGKEGEGGGTSDKVGNPFEADNPVARETHKAKDEALSMDRGQFQRIGTAEGWLVGLLHTLVRGEKAEEGGLCTKLVCMVSDLSRGCVMGWEVRQK